MDNEWTRPTVGTTFYWMATHVTVTRVAKDSSWADVRCVQPGGPTWTKRLPLPMPEAAELVVPPIPVGE